MELNSSVQWIVIYLGTVTNFCSKRCSVSEGKTIGCIRWLNLQNHSDKKKANLVEGLVLKIKKC